MSRSTDRDLLFGLLALQNNFIGRDALIAAFDQWNVEHARPLDRILLDRGDLTPGRRAALAMLVDEHIQVHGGAVERSLAAIGPVGAVCEGLSRIAAAAPDLQASLSLVATPRCDDDPFRTMAPENPGAPTSEGGRFRILRPHAYGGLGQVSLALDRELGRPVALKEIQDQRADEPESRARFVQEAEITGKLEHPGIVPVYSLGRDATGRPFYAMRFIQGESLKEAIAGFHADEALRKDQVRRLARLRELLRRFTDVCDAIAYAHSRGVLHRDIKPGNIMLGPYGETLVVDWGLAKTMDPAREAAGDDDAAPPAPSVADTPIRLSGQSGSRAETVAGSPIGTPAFAGPEQVLGQIDRIGPASDVYGLGATLYNLLTGRPPVESRELDVIIRRVSKGQVPRPRSIDPKIPRPLEAICLKAMAVEPDRRYESARALAEDVKRWMDDAPVSAYREPVAVRAGRWVRRHQQVVTGLAAAVLVGLMALGIMYLRESSINGELSRAKDQSDRRLDQTLEAIGDYYTGVSGEVLLGQKEFQDLRARLLEKPRKFYEQLARELAASPAPDERTRSLLARGHHGLGVIYRTLSRSEDARVQLRAAESLYRGLTQAKPEVASYQSDLAANLQDLAELLLIGIEFRDAEPLAREAIAIRGRLAADHPEVPAHRHQLAGSYNQLGRIRQMLEDLPRAAEAYRQAADLWSALAAEAADSVAYREGLGVAYNNLGMIQQTSGDHAGASASFLRSIEFYEKIGATRPEARGLAPGLCNTYRNLGHAQEARGDLPGALGWFRKAIDLRTRLVADRPNIPAYRSGLATDYLSLADLLRRQGQEAEAAVAYRQAIELYDQLAAAYPAIPEYRRGLAGTYTDMAALQMVLGDLPSSAESLGQAIALFSGLAEAHPDVPNYRVGLSSGHENLGSVRQQMGDLRGAAESFRESIRLLEGLVADSPDVPDHRSRLAHGHVRLGAIETLTGSPHAANSYARAVQLYEKLAEEQPGVPHYRSGLAWSLAGLGMFQASSGRYKDAAASYNRSIAGYSRLVEEQPGVPEYRSLLASVLGNLGHTQINSEDYRGAEKSCGRSIAILAGLADDHPSVLEYRHSRALAHNNLGEALRRANRLDDCLPHYEEARKAMLGMVKEYPDVLTYKQSLAGILTNIGLVDLAQGRAFQGLARLKEAYGYWVDPFKNNPRDPFYADGLIEGTKVLSDLFGPRPAAKPADPPAQPPAADPGGP